MLGSPCLGKLPNFFGGVCNFKCEGFEGAAPPDELRLVTVPHYVLFAKTFVTKCLKRQLCTILS